MSENEDDFRLLGVASSYGTGTRSYNRSAGKKEMDRQRRAATERWLENRKVIAIGPFCRCRSFRYPHEISRHEELTSDYDWRTPEERHR